MTKGTTSVATLIHELTFRTLTSNTLLSLGKGSWTSTLAVLDAKKAVSLTHGITTFAYVIIDPGIDRYLTLEWLPVTRDGKQATVSLGETGKNPDYYK